MRNAPLLATTLFTLAAMSPPAHAQLSGDQVVSAADAAGIGKGPESSFSGFLSAGQIGEDVFMNLNLRLSFDQENWGVGFQAPLRLRLIDNDPQDGDVLRMEDWDEWQDFLKFIRYVYIGRRDKTGPFYVRIGELSNLSIGHGTIVYRYNNSLDIDRWRIGTNVAVNIGDFGAEVVVSDVGRLGSNAIMAGYRLSVRPLSLLFGGAEVDPETGEPAEESSTGYDPLSRFVIGHTLMVDPTAPYTLETREVTDTNGNLRTVVVTNDQNLPNVTAERAFAVVGIDFGYELLRGEPLSITPYIDINKMTEMDSGWGLHMGVLWGLRVPAVIDTLTVDLRTEYRRVSGDYLGPYFNTTYDIERYVANPGGALPLTKLFAVSQGDTGRNGVFFDLLAGFPNFVYIGGEFIDYDGGQNDGQLRLSLEVPALEFVRFSAFYYRINIGGLSDMFALDDRSSILGQVAVPIGVFSLVGRWWRVWRGTGEGGYESVDDWSVGVGINLTF